MAIRNNMPISLASGPLICARFYRSRASYTFIETQALTQ